MLHVLERLGAGGTEWQAAHVAAALSRRGIASHITALEASDAPAALRELLREAGVGLSCLAIPHRWSLARGAARVARLARDFGADILHARLYFPGLHVAASRALLPRPRRVWSYHNVIYEYPDRTAWDEARRLLEVLAARGFDAFAAVSAGARESYARHVGSHPIHVVPNGVLLDELRGRPAERARVAEIHRLDPAGLWAVVPARFVFEKAHDVLVAAATRLPPAVPVRFLCAGRGPLLEASRAAATRAGVEDRFVFLGELERPSLLDLIQVSDLVVLPSLFEGFPNAAAEAMALGRPLISSDIAALRDLVVPEVSGLLVPAGDPDALAAAISRATRDSALRHRLGDAGRVRIEAKFGIESVAEEWLTLYRRLLTDPRAARAAT